MWRESAIRRRSGSPPSEAFESVVAPVAGQSLHGIVCSKYIRQISKLREVRHACNPCLQPLRTKEPRTGKILASTGRCGNCKSPLPPIAEPLAVDVASFDEVIQNSPVPVLADFWAEWCAPCHAAAPEVTKTAADMAGKAVVLKVDTQQYPELAGRFNVRGIPNFAVFSGARLVLQQAGLVGHDQMEQWLRSAIPVAT